jgi:20S proteasome subunit alpha 5
LTRSISDLALHFGEGDPTKREKPMSRPFGVALLVGGIDESGPCLYQTDPTGTMIKYEARGIGPAEESIKLELESSYKPEMALKEAEKLALSCLKKNMEEDINKFNVELVTIPTTTRKVEFRDEAYVDALLATLS